MEAQPWVSLARGSRAADELLQRIAPEKVRKANPLTKTGFDDVVRSVALDMLDAVEKPEQKAAAELQDLLLVNWSKLSPESQAKAIRQAEALIARLGSQVAPPLRKVLAMRGKQIVATTKGAAVSRWELPIAAVWGEQDARIVDHATNSQTFYVTDYYGNVATAFGQRARDIVANGLRDGLDYQAIGKDLKTAIGASIGRSQSHFPMVASVFAARSRTWSVLSTFEEAAIETWRFSAVMDEATCFARGTRILMGDGRTMKAIELIKPGDVVMSCKGRPRRVLATKVEPARKWGEMLFAAPGVGPLIVTRTHGILTSKGWIRAQRIEPEDHAVIWSPENTCGPKAPTSAIWSDEREWGGRRGRHDARALNVEPWPHPALERIACVARVASVVWSETGRTENAFDLEVEEDHGYIAEGVVVHNSHICRFLDGQVFSVQASANRFRQVAESNDPAAVKDLQPFVRERLDEDGKTVMYVGDFQVARVENSAMGRKDQAGSFSGAANAKALEGRGIAAPPLHPHCRSELVPE